LSPQHTHYTCSSATHPALSLQGDHVKLDEWQKSSSWANAQFESDRHSTAGTNCTDNANCHGFAFLEASWWEQRFFSTGLATDTLAAAPTHPLWRQYVKPELDALAAPVVIPNPHRAGSFTQFYPDTTGPITVGGVTIGFDASSGALSTLECDGKSWASATNMLLGLQYQSYNISQFQTFQRSYSNLTKPPGYFPHGKLRMICTVITSTPLSISLRRTLHQ
jgi:hypothetical protein